MIANIGRAGTFGPTGATEQWHKVAAFAKRLCQFARIQIATYAFSGPDGRVPFGAATRIVQRSAFAALHRLQSVPS